MNRFGFGFLLGGALALVVTAGAAGLTHGSDQPAAPPSTATAAKSCCGDHHDAKTDCAKACHDAKAGKHACACKAADGKAVRSCCGSKETTAKGCCAQCPSCKSGHQSTK